MNGSTLRSLTGQNRSWRMREWPHDPTVAHLVFVNHGVVPTVGDLDEAVHHARVCGARAIRTSALFPRSAEVVTAAGFSVIDRLALLVRSPIGDRHDEPVVRTSPMRLWHHEIAARIDRDAFGPLWGNDVAGLRDIKRATPHHRARVTRVGTTITGFAISGSAGENGYLQRLAVAPTARREGHATALVTDALEWMNSAGLESALVNTGVTNTAALELYRGLGFRQLDTTLVIAELSMTGGTAIRLDHRDPPATAAR